MTKDPVEWPGLLFWSNFAHSCRHVRELRKRYDIASGLADYDLLGDVKRGASWNHLRHSVECALDGIEVIHLEVEQIAPKRRIGHCRHIAQHARSRLVHDLDAIANQNDEAELFAVRHFDGLGEAEAIDPERQ